MSDIQRMRSRQLRSNKWVSQWSTVGPEASSGGIWRRAERTRAARSSVLLSDPFSATLPGARGRPPLLRKDGGGCGPALTVVADAPPGPAPISVAAEPNPCCSIRYRNFSLWACRSLARCSKARASSSLASLGWGMGESVRRKLESCGAEVAVGVPAVPAGPARLAGPAGPAEPAGPVATADPTVEEEVDVEAGVGSGVDVSNAPAADPDPRGEVGPIVWSLPSIEGSDWPDIFPGRQDVIPGYGGPLGPLERCPRSGPKGSGGTPLALA